MPGAVGAPARTDSKMNGEHAPSTASGDGDNSSGGVAVVPAVANEAEEVVVPTLPTTGKSATVAALVLVVLGSTCGSGCGEGDEQGEGSREYGRVDGDGSRVSHLGSGRGCGCGGESSGNVEEVEGR